MPDESEIIAQRAEIDVALTGVLRAVEATSQPELAGDRVRRLWGGFTEQGFAAGYDQGWQDAKAGRAYGTTPSGLAANEATREEIPPSVSLPERRDLE